MTKQFNISMKIGMLLLSGCVLQSCKLNKGIEISRYRMERQAEQNFPEFAAVRRQLHQHPELSGKEVKTKEFVRQYLLKLGLEVKSDLYGNSIIGVLKGAQRGKKIAWRSDMDALAMNNGENVYHGCGHDAHMAIALGIAKIMAENKQHLKGDVYFIFQPEEESFKGAKNMVETNFLTDSGIEEIYGLHVTVFPVGQILVKPNEMFAHQRQIQVQMKDIILNSQQLNELSVLVSKKLNRRTTGTNPMDIQQITDLNLGLTSANSMFRDYLFTEDNFRSSKRDNIQTLEMNIYETNQAAIPQIIPIVKAILGDMGLSKYVESISYNRENPTVMNDPKLTQEAYAILRQENRRDIYLSQGQVPYFNDDFAYFQQKIPGVYFFLGGSNFSKGIIAMNHSPNFQIDDACLKIGISAFSYLLSRRLLD